MSGLEKVNRIEPFMGWKHDMKFVKKQIKNIIYTKQIL